MTGHKQNCELCLYWRRRPHSAYVGNCRKSPPVIVHIPTGGYSDTKFPETRDMDWCGEFKDVSAGHPIDNGRG